MIIVKIFIYAKFDKYIPIMSTMLIASSPIGANLVKIQKLPNVNTPINTTFVNIEYPKTFPIKTKL